MSCSTGARRAGPLPVDPLSALVDKHGGIARARVQLGEVVRDEHEVALYQDRCRCDPARASAIAVGRVASTLRYARQCAPGRPRRPAADTSRRRRPAAQIAGDAGRARHEKVTMGKFVYGGSGGVIAAGGTPPAPGTTTTCVATNIHSWLSPRAGSITGTLRQTELVRVVGSAELSLTEVRDTFRARGAKEMFYATHVVVVPGAGGLPPAAMTRRMARRMPHPLSAFSSRA